MRAKQLLVNELASLLGLPLFCTPEPTRSLAGGIWGERSVAYSISLEPQETQLESSRFCHPIPSPSSLWYKQRKSVKEKKPLSQDSSHSADSIIQRYPLQQHVFLRSQVHTGEEEKENIAYILQTAGYEVDCWLCVAIVKRITLLVWQININIFLNFFTLTLTEGYFCFFRFVCWELMSCLGMANSKRQSLVCNSAHNICRLLSSWTNAETITYVAQNALTWHLGSYLYCEWSLRAQRYSSWEKP